MTPCVFSWLCLHPRDEWHLPARKPHKIRLVRIVGLGGPLDVVFETELATGAWIPPVTHTQATSYRLEVCCSDPGYGQCKWEVLASINNLLGTTTGCPTCNPVGIPCGKVVRSEGAHVQQAILTVEFNSDTLTCCDGHPTTNWAGVYSLLAWDEGNCIVDLNVTYSNPRNCQVGFITTTEYDFLRILWNFSLNTVHITIGTAKFHNNNQHCSVARIYRYNMNPAGTLLTPSGSSCNDLVLAEAGAASFAFTSSVRQVSAESQDCGSCYYPASYNPIVSVQRQ